jgi:hypothetical protein
MYNSEEVENINSNITKLLICYLLKIENILRKDSTSPMVYLLEDLMNIVLIEEGNNLKAINDVITMIENTEDPFLPHKKISFVQKDNLKMSDLHVNLILENMIIKEMEVMIEIQEKNCMRMINIADNKRVIDL